MCTASSAAATRRFALATSVRCRRPARWLPTAGQDRVAGVVFVWKNNRFEADAIVEAQCPTTSRQMIYRILCDGRDLLSGRTRFSGAWSAGRVMKIIRRRNPARSQVAYADDYQLALLPHDTSRRRRPAKSIDGACRGA